MSYVTPSRGKTSTIFVSIAAYCERWLAQTIADACNKAENPLDLVFAVIDQHSHSRREELIALCGNSTLRYLHLDPVDARGVCWARALAFSLYRGEQYLLQIDAHTIFELAWDSRLKSQLHSLGSVSAKPLITNYPWGFTMNGRTPVVDPRRSPEVTLVLKPSPDSRLSHDNVTLRFVADNLTVDEPVPACHIGAGFIFTHGQFINQVPYDPELYFHGEEQSLALRAFTRGWDMFHLREIPLYHLYKTSEEPSPSHHWHGHWDALRDVTSAQAIRHAEQRLLDLIDQRCELGIYGLGHQRSLFDYAQTFGIDYSAREIRSGKGIEWYEAKVKSKTSCISNDASDTCSIPDSSHAIDSAHILTILEINPHAPRPFTFSDCAVCLVESLNEAGFAVQQSFNTIPDHGMVLILGWTPEWLEQNSHLLTRERTLLFNAEQLQSLSPLVTPAYLRELGQWSVIDYHEANADFIRQLHGSAAQVTTVPLVPGCSVTYGHTCAPPEETETDVVFYGSLNARREHVINQLRALGLRVEVVSGAYGPELTPALCRAKLVLHVHYYDTALYPALRLLQPVALGVPVVCETSVDSRWNDWSSSGMVFADYADLAKVCLDQINNLSQARSAAQECLGFARSMKMMSSL